MYGIQRILLQLMEQYRTVQSHNSIIIPLQHWGIFWIKKGQKQLSRLFNRENIEFYNHLISLLDSMQCIPFVNNNIFCPFFIGNVPMCTTVFLAHFDSTTKESKRVPSFYFFPRSTRFWKSDSWCFHVFFLGFAAAIPCKPRIPRCCGSSI